MESSERSITEENLCNSLNGCINLTKTSNNVLSTKTRQKRPDREFYVPPNAHMSKVKSPVTVNKTSDVNSSKLIKSNQRKLNQSKLKKTDANASITVIEDQQEKHLINKKDVCKNSVNKEEKIEQKENHSTTKVHGSTKATTLKVTNDLSEAEPSWDDIYDDDGDCVEPPLVDQFSDTDDDRSSRRVGVNKKNSKDLNDDFNICEPDDSKLSHILEIYDFPPDLRTQDLVTSLSVFNSRDFDIKWVDDSHALAVFSSQTAAKEAMSMPYNNIRLRPLNEAIKESRMKAQKCAEFLLPYKQRPQTSAILARRLVTGALGIRSNISSEQRAAEKKRLKEAKEKRRLAMKLTQDAWEGNVG